MPIWAWISLGVGVPLLIIIGLILWAIIDGMIQDKRYLEHGTKVIGWIVQANPELYQGGGIDKPAQVLVSFDTNTDPPDPFMYNLAEEVARIKKGQITSPAEAELSVVMSDDTYRPFQRYRLPDELTGGREVYSMHVWVKRSLLPGTTLQYVFVRCLIIRDDPKSRAMMIPYEAKDEAFRGPRARFAGEGTISSR